MSEILERLSKLRALNQMHDSVDFFTPPNMGCFCGDKILHLNFTRAVFTVTYCLRYAC